MNEEVFVGRLFKTSKNKWGVVLIVVFALIIMACLGIIAYAESKTTAIIAGVVIAAVLITVAFTRKLSLNEPDDKNIYISRAGVAVGMDRYDWSVITKLGIYVDAFYGFTYRWVRGTGKALMAWTTRYILG